MKYTKEGIERSGEIWNEGLTTFPGSTLLRIKLAWYHMARLMNFISNDPFADLQKGGELARQVLASEHLSPQVTRLATWLMSHVLVQETDFEGAVVALKSAVALAPHDAFMDSSLMMVLVQAGRMDEALQWANKLAARDHALGWFYNHRKGWAHLALGQLSEAADALRQTDFNDSHLLLAVAQLRLGRQSDARAEVLKMMKSCPGITVHRWRSGYSFLDTGILDDCAVDLAQLGLPK
jgi:tetratricopeptide (TPR) repeat protein